MHFRPGDTDPEIVALKDEQAALDPTGATCKTFAQKKPPEKPVKKAKKTITAKRRPKKPKKA